MARKNAHFSPRSLWLRPTGEALDRIRNAIRRAHEHDGGLPVDPHVTLLSGFRAGEADGVARLRQLAARLRPFPIRLGRIEGTADYYRSLYAVVEPSRELAAARHVAAETFAVEPSPFEPHLSLLYGNFGEARREALAGVLGGRLDISFTVTAVDLVNSARGIPASSWRTLCSQPLAEQ